MKSEKWIFCTAQKFLRRWLIGVFSFFIFHFSLFIAHAQPVGRFLTDSIEIGRPFRYSLTYRHAPDADVLFPDTARQFAPYLVRDVAVYATQTTGSGPAAVSRDSAVYTLLSFETDSVQTLQVPVRLIGSTDCTEVYAPPDTVFLQSKLIARPVAQTLAANMSLAQLQQQFNYPVLIFVLAGITVLALLAYGLFGQISMRQWRLYRLNRRHIQFMKTYNRLSRNLTADTASDVANNAIILWKTYLERLDKHPYISLTTPEIAERINDERVTNALREADRMIYGGVFTAQSQPALRVLSDIATVAYRRRRAALQHQRSQAMPSPEPV